MIRVVFVLLVSQVSLCVSCCLIQTSHIVLCCWSPKFNLGFCGVGLNYSHDFVLLDSNNSHCVFFSVRFTFNFVVCAAVLTNMFSRFFVLYRSHVPICVFFIFITKKTEINSQLIGQKLRPCDPFVKYKIRGKPALHSMEYFR